jgi:glycosyltransferase involved in cell wall biosynthesis
MKLSILIPSLFKRQSLLDSLLSELNKQITECNAHSEVEVIVKQDNKEVTTGEKRNQLLELAKGEYIVFIDDDDEIYFNYLLLILEAIETNVDCIGTQGHYSINGSHKTLWKLSKDYADHDGNDGILYRRANHLSPVKRVHALNAKFPHISNAEDKAYSERLNKYLKTETVIDFPIYHYKYSSYNKEYV